MACTVPEGFYPPGQLYSTGMVWSRARCVPLQYLSNAAHGVKLRPQPATTEIQTGATNTQEEIVVRSHLTQREAWCERKRETESSTDPCVAMLAPNMDCERYQDLSELSWFSSAPQPWAAVDPRITDTSMHSNGERQPLSYETIEYALNDFNSHMYTMPRSDSMEEVKTATALTDILPMRHHEALQVKDYVKIKEEVVTDVKPNEDFLKLDGDLMIFDTPDLLSELGGGDLIDYITSDDLPRSEPSPQCLYTPPPLADVPSPPSSIEASPPLPTPKPKMKETYLAIPRELTAGSSDDKKIPKMLILKTPETSTISLSDLGMSIAERIKTMGKRQRTKRYSDSYEDNDDQVEESQTEEEEERPNKRARRTSTTSSASLTDRYRELRDRNNEASRKSRMNRKEKEKDLSKTLKETEQENTRLRARADELEKLVLSLRKLLLQIVVNKGTSR